MVSFWGVEAQVQGRTFLWVHPAKGNFEVALHSTQIGTRPALLLFFLSLFLSFFLSVCLSFSLSLSIYIYIYYMSVDLKVLVWHL